MVNIVERISLLCNEHETTFAAVERECGLSNGSIRRWATNTPSTDKLQKVADYFRVSLDYLQGRTDYKYIASENNKNSLEEEFPEGVYVLRRASKELSPEAKEQMLKIMKTFLEEDDDE